MSAPETAIEHPWVEIARLRAKCERAVDKLLTILDTLGPDADLEPSLGGLDVTGPYGDQRRWADGLGDDAEDEHDGCEPDADDEHTLGRTEHESAGTPHVHSFPSDGELLLSASENRDQRAWVHPQPAELRACDREDQCEDEGAVFDDEADDWGWEAPDGGTSYPSAFAPWPPGRAV